LKEDKITLALLWPRYAGKVTSVNDLVVRLDKNRFNLIFVFLRGDADERNFLREAGYPVFYLSNAKRVSAFRFSVLSGLVRILKEHKVDVLHCHAHKATVCGAMAGALAGTPVVLAHVHGLGRSRNLRRKLTNLVLFRRINRIICVANSVKDDVLKNNWCVSPEKVAVLENSVDYDRFADVSISKADAKQKLGLPSGAFVFGMVGRLAPTKGLPYLIEAFSKVRAQKPSAHLVLLGEGPCKAELQEQASHLSCRDSVHFLGHRGDIEQLIRGMDVFVLSSVAEGMPRAILEVMAAGIPCIATRVGGIAEIMSSDDVGILVPAKDSEALAKAMIDLGAAMKEQLERYAQKARDRIRQFYSHDVVREKLSNLYLNEFEACTKSRARG
jgi:glycosyltransferase involved in cell wall biosynthesis